MVAAVAVAVVVWGAGCRAFAPGFGEFGGERVRDLRDRTAQQDTMLALRLDALLPALMEEADLDCWLMIADGPAGDPLVPLMTVRATHLEGKGALLLCDGDRGVVGVAIGDGFAANDVIYEVVETSEESPLAAALNERLAASAPQRIGINDARLFPDADGLTASNARWLRDNLEPEWSSRLVSSRPLVESLLAGQIDAEAPLFVESARLTGAILADVLNDDVVVAAGTSLLDLEWEVRERISELDLEVAYAPRALVYRPSSALEAERRMGLDLKLQPGDLFFLSFGVRYLGYANRVGRWAYLLHTDETAAPAWVDDAMAGLADAAERVAAAIAVGQDGGAVLDSSRAAGLGSGDLVAVERVGRLREGAVELGSFGRPMSLWGSRYRLAAGTGLAITLQTTVQPSGPGSRPATLLLIDTALVSAAGTRFVVPLQRTPWLIE